MSDILTLVLRNDPAEIGRMLDAFSAFRDRHRIPEAVATDIALALDELAANIIAYAWPDGLRHEFLLRLHVDEHAATIELIDDGVAYDPTAASPPDFPADIDDWRIGGLGIHFVRTTMDKLEYRRDGQRNHLTVVKFLSAR